MRYDVIVGFMSNLMEEKMMQRRAVAPAIMLTDARGDNNKSRSLTREKAGAAFGEHQSWRGSSAWRERAIANRQVGGSSPLPDTNMYLTGCSMLITPNNRNPVGPAKVEQDYTRKGSLQYTPSVISSQGGPMNILKPEKNSLLSPLLPRAVRSAPLYA